MLIRRTAIVRDLGFLAMVGYCWEADGQRVIGEAEMEVRVVMIGEGR